VVSFSELLKMPLMTAVLAFLACASISSVGEASRLAVAPVSRVVDLLTKLQEKLEEDFKAEETLFKKYECWARSVKEAKEATNTAAKSRIDSLTAYVKDIEAGKIEFTTERVDLEKQVAGLTQDLDTAKALREKEAKDFEAAKVELEQGITALTEAIKVLQEGTSASLLTKHGAVRRLSARWSLRKALEFSKSVLTKDDARLLQHLMNIDVPTYDWKKLNREATFKKSYDARSGNIISTLTSLQTTFTDNLNEATAKESEALATYESLKSSKETMLSTAQEALVALVEENGARGLSMAEANDEIAALNEQVEADTDFIATVQTAYDTKNGEWTARKELRNKEISAISEAISVLHSDEARDTFKKSFTSQGYLLLQQAQEGYPHRATARAKELIASLASRSGDKRLALLSNLARATGLDQVITQIDTLVGILNTEEQDDLQKKESCEADLANTTQTAKTVSRAIDGITDDITRTEEKISEIASQVKEQEETLAGLNSTLVQIADQRAAEAKQFEENKATDTSALEVIDEAVLILQTLLKDLGSGTSTQNDGQTLIAVRSSTGTTRQHRPVVPTQRAAVQGERKAASSVKSTPISRLLQFGKRGAVSQPYDIQAGEAPPPPPMTWTEPAYAGASGESSGILSILSLVREDVQKDIDLAETAENSAIEAYESQAADLEESMKGATEAIAAYDEETAALEGDKVEKASEKDVKKGELSATMQEIESMRPGCDFVLVNFDIRNQKRHVEIDGLLQAKAILQGASFS